MTLQIILIPNQARIGFLWSTEKLNMICREINEQYISLLTKPTATLVILHENLIFLSILPLYSLVCTDRISTGLLINWCFSYKQGLQA